MKGEQGRDTSQSFPLISVRWHFWNFWLPFVTPMSENNVKFFSSSIYDEWIMARLAAPRLESR